MANTWQHETPQGVKPVESGRPFDPGYEPLAFGQVTTADWQHVCACRFGDGRPCAPGDSTHWTGDSYRYDIYRQSHGHGDGTRWALRWWNGGGEGWLLGGANERHGEACLLPLIAAQPDEARRWDYAHFLWQTAHKSARAGEARKEMQLVEAAAQGRLKIRRRKGMVQLEVAPAHAQEARKG